jgi:exodeoxyribonuclease VII large subunit
LRVAELTARPCWGVAALLLAAGDALQARFGACTVRGELSGFSRAASGHCYFTLKDADGATASLRCAMFRRASVLLDFMPRDGQQVELRGRIAVYEPRGELQFIVEAMRTVGAGALYEEFLRLKARLEAQGLFDPARKRPIAPFPVAVGVVSSLAAAALHDVLTALARRSPQVRVVVYPSAVQGADAPAALIDALALAARRREVDTLILARGGGSLEDLWAFNDERLVRAIAASPIPVVCGVGHETDVTLSDLAADLRAATPTAAAELAAPARDDALAALARLAERLRRTLRRELDRHAQRLDRTTLQLARPGQTLARHAQRLESLDHRRCSALGRSLADASRRPAELARRLLGAQHRQRERAQHHLETLQQRLQGLDPRRVLARGYAWVTDAQGQPLVTVSALAPGQAVQAVWSDGRANARIIDVTPDAPS